MVQTKIFFLKKRVSGYRFSPQIFVSLMEFLRLSEKKSANIFLIRTPGVRTFDVYIYICVYIIVGSSIMLMKYQDIEG